MFLEIENNPTNRHLLPPIRNFKQVSFENSAMVEAPVNEDNK